MRTHVRNVRIGAAAAGLVAALVLTGCSSDGGDGGDEGKDKGSAGSSAGADGSDSPDEGADAGSGDAGSGDADSGAADGGSEGSWVATADGNPLALVIAGKQATLLGENVLCSGTASGDAIKLKCAKGDSNRTEGTVESVNGTSMTVSWQGAGQDQFTRTKGGKLPEGLPTAGLPES